MCSITGWLSRQLTQAHPSLPFLAHQCTQRHVTDRGVQKGALDWQHLAGTQPALQLELHIF